MISNTTQSLFIVDSDIILPKKKKFHVRNFALIYGPFWLLNLFCPFLMVICFLFSKTRSIKGLLSYWNITFIFILFQWISDIRAKALLMSVFLKKKREQKLSSFCQIINFWWISVLLPPPYPPRRN